MAPHSPNLLSGAPTGRRVQAEVSGESPAHCPTTKNAMPVLSAPGLGRATHPRRTAPSGPRLGSRLLGCIAVLILGACTPTRIMLTATPEAMGSIDSVYVVAGTEAQLEEKLGPDKTSRDFYNFTETLRLKGTQDAGALAYVELRKLSGKELVEAQAEAQGEGAKPLPSNRWRVTKRSDPNWMKSEFDLLGDAIVTKIAKSKFNLYPDLAVAVIVGTNNKSRRFRTRIAPKDLTPGGFWFITRGKRLTYDLKADKDPERVLDSEKLSGQGQ